MTATKAGGIAGFIIHLVICALLLMAGGFKLSGQLPEEALKQTAERGLLEELMTIAVGEMIVGVLLVLPWTASLGTLLVSAFFGGTIVAHMQTNESYLMNSIFLIATWVGAGLRYPGMFSSFMYGRNTAKKGD